MNYLKMSDVLNLPVDPNKLEVYGYDSTTPLAEVERYVAHAINVHDDLVTKHQDLLQGTADPRPTIMVVGVTTALSILLTAALCVIALLVLSTAKAIAITVVLSVTLSIWLCAWIAAIVTTMERSRT